MIRFEAVGLEPARFFTWFEPERSGDGGRGTRTQSRRRYFLGLRMIE